MAEVFLACERGAHNFERLVVIKRILPHLAEHPQFVDMFLQEARICARINHPNVVQIFELGEEDGQPFIAMEYVQGCTLRELVAAGEAEEEPLPVGVATSLAEQACAGAHALHELKDQTGRPYGLIHRDLSPHNLMVTQDGYVKLLDFGIVKATEGVERTKTGVLKGKLAYMSPEQARQDELDRRSDIFTLGIVLWELLAGEKLFGGKSELAVMQAIVNGEVRDLRAVRPDVPEPIVGVVQRALAHHVDQRFETADAMRQALAEAARLSATLHDRDTVTDYIQRVAGDRLAKRRQDVSQALDRTLVTLTRGVTKSQPTGVTTATQATIATTYGFVGALGALALTGGAALAVVVLVIAAGAGLYGAGVVGADDGPPAHVRPEGEPLELLFAPTIDAAILLDDLEPLRRYLEDETGLPWDFTVAPSYGETSRRLVEGEVGFASLPPYLYLQTQLQDPSVTVLAVKLFDGSSGTDGVLLVPESSPYTSPKDLKGKRVCYSDSKSTTGYLLPRAYLRAQGLDPDRDFSEVRISGNHLQVIRDIAEGRCDVGGAYSGAFTTGATAGVPVAATRVLAITGRTPHDAIVAGPKADPAVVGKLGAALLGLDPPKHAGVPVIGEVERLSGFYAPDTDTYRRLQEAVAQEAAKAGKR